MKNLLLFLLFLPLLILGCTAAPQDVQTCVVGEPAGFLMGLWHGFISPITFILSLFIEKIEVFALNNTGGWYMFGFLIGVGSSMWGSSLGAKKSRKSR